MSSNVKMKPNLSNGESVALSLCIFAILPIHMEIQYYIVKQKILLFFSKCHNILRFCGMFFIKCFNVCTFSASFNEDEKLEHKIFSLNYSCCSWVIYLHELNIIIGGKVKISPFWENCITFQGKMNSNPQWKFFTQYWGYSKKLTNTRWNLFVLHIFLIKKAHSLYGLTRKAQ